MACDVPYVLYTLPECLCESEGECILRSRLGRCSPAPAVSVDAFVLPCVSTPREPPFPPALLLHKPS